MRRLLILSTLILIMLGGCAKQEVTPIKIGVIIPLTGNGAIYGDWGQKALEIAKDDINKQGGILGRPIELLYEDGKFQATDTVAAYHKLVDVDNVKFIMTLGSGPAMAVAPLANKEGIIQMDFSATTSKYSTENDYTFRTSLKATQFGIDGARLLTKQPFTAKNVGILYINNEQGQDIFAYFEKEAKEQGLTIAVAEKFDQDGTDFRTQITKLKEKNPDWVFLISHVKEAGIIVKQMNELGMFTPIFSHVFSIEGEPFFASAGKDFKNNVVYMAPKYRPDDPKEIIKAYNEEYARRYGKSSEYFGAFAYDALKVLAFAMQQCEKTEDTGCVKDKLFQVKNFPGLTGDITFDKYGDTYKELMLKTIRNGSYVVYE